MFSAVLLNYYCRRIGIWFLSLIPAFLGITLLFLAIPIVSSEDQPILFLIINVTYIILIVIALPFALNGYYQEKAFNDEIKRITNTGLLIEGVEGFLDIESSIKLLYRGSYSVTGAVIISFFVFISSQLLDTSASLYPTARFFIFVASIGLLAISSGASILLRLPDKSALQPGGLMKFYSPKSLSLRLDNILADSIFTRLDPITRIRMDEWSQSIVDHLNENYLNNLDTKTRLERAREKIYLMVYFKEYIPDIMTESIFMRELGEILETSYVQEFLEGVDSGISSSTLTKIIKDVSKEIPEIFQLIQRIVVQVADNLGHLNTLDTYITITHPTSHIGNIDPLKIIVFILNLKNVQRKVQIQAQTSMSSLDPDDVSQKLQLDIGNLKLPKDSKELKFSSSSEPTDILRLVSEILQIGDAINLQFRPNRFGTHVLNILVEDSDTGIINGRSVVINVHRDLNYYLKTVGAKALGYAGAAISFIGIGMGSFVGLFGI